MKHIALTGDVCICDHLPDDLVADELSAIDETKISCPKCYYLLLRFRLLSPDLKMHVKIRITDESIGTVGDTMELDLTEAQLADLDARGAALGPAVKKLIAAYRAVNQ